MADRNLSYVRRDYLLPIQGSLLDPDDPDPNTVDRLMLSYLVEVLSDEIQWERVGQPWRNHGGDEVQVWGQTVAVLVEAGVDHG